MLINLPGRKGCGKYLSRAIWVNRSFIFIPHAAKTIQIDSIDSEYLYKLNDFSKINAVLCIYI